MNETELYRGILIGWFGLSAAVFVLLFFITAPYGRHVRAGWGPLVNARAGWIAMESVSSLTFALFFVVGGSPRTAVAVIFLIFWQLHYVYRAFVFPFRLPSDARPMPLVIVASGMLFNVINGALNGRFLFGLSPGYEIAWFGDPRFIAGTLLFLGGMFINHHADGVLRRLRRTRGGGHEMTGESAGYSIPRGGLYRWVSCPNYLGELIEWAGWALATWSLPGLAFFVWTAANLIPRALSHHRWYRRTFPDYPPGRRAVIPGLF